MSLPKGVFNDTSQECRLPDQNQILWTTAVQNWSEVHVILHALTIWQIMALDEYDPSTVCTNAHYTNFLLSKVYKLSDSTWSGTMFANKVSVAISLR